MEFPHGFLLLTAVHLLAAASPGPDFALVTRHAVRSGQRAGILCSLGIALGLAVHITYSALGLATVIAGSAALLWWIKLLAGAYLIGLGIQGLRSRPHTAPAEQAQEEVAPFRMIGQGFFCNLLNPKAPIYFVSLFTVVVSPTTPPLALLAYALWLMFLQFAWFTLVATVFASRGIGGRIQRAGHLLDRVFGGAMLLLGLKVLSSRSS